MPETMDAVLTTTDAAGQKITWTGTFTKTDPPPPLTLNATMEPTTGPPGTIITITANPGGGQPPVTTILEWKGQQVAPTPENPLVWKVTA